MMERMYNKTLVIGIIVTLIGAVAIPSISGYNKISIQSTMEELTSFPLNADYVNAYWKFDECSGSTAYDSSGNGYDGSIHGCTWIGGYSGCALDFDGLDDYVDFDDYAKDSLGFNKTDDLIISFYFKSSSLDKGIIYSTCRGDAYGYNPGVHIALNSDGSLQVQVWRLNCGILMNSTSIYNDNLWHYAQIFYNGESVNPTVDVYCDGTFDSSYGKYVCSFYSDQFKYAQMGRNSYELNDYFDGKLDEFKIIKYPGGNTQQPPIIDGPTSGVPDVEYDYTFTIVDTENDDCEINIDFNGYETGWLGPYESGEEITVSHKWDTEGTFNIRVKSRDIWGESPWSDPFPVEIIENLPPNSPIITGPNSGEPGTSYEFTFNAVDPDGDNVRYIIDWGDSTSDTTTYAASGTDVTVAHTWTKSGNFIIKAKAEDELGQIGPETTKTVTMPRSKAINNPFLNWLQNHPNLFPLLQKVLQQFGL